MRTSLKKGIVFLLSVCGMSLLADNANAFIDMPNRERVQAIAWTIEGATVVVIVLVFWFIWRMGKRAQANRKSREENSLE
jgi:heme/copper-type cytochrome/quinol oxidase subunit 2